MWIRVFGLNCVDGRFDTWSATSALSVIDRDTFIKKIQQNGHRLFAWDGGQGVTPPPVPATWREFHTQVQLLITSEQFIGDRAKATGGLSEWLTKMVTEENPGVEETPPTVKPTKPVTEIVQDWLEKMKDADRKSLIDRAWEATIAAGKGQ